MALSGSRDFELTANGVIKAAYRKLQIHTLTQKHKTDGLEALELVLKSLASEGLNLIFPQTQEWITQALVASTDSYTLSNYILKIHEAFIRRDNYDTIVEHMNVSEYSDLGDKAVEGLPNRYWFNKQNNEIFLYPVPENATDVVHMLVSNKFQDVDALTNNVDIDATWYKALVYTLASDLSFERDIPVQIMQAMTAQSAIWIEKAKSIHLSSESVYIGIDRTGR